MPCGFNPQGPCFPSGLRISGVLVKCRLRAPPPTGSVGISAVRPKDTHSQKSPYEILINTGPMYENWCFWTLVLEKTLESPLDCKEIQPVHPKGNQSWIFIGRTDAEAETPILWPPDVKNWLIGKDPDALTLSHKMGPLAFSFWFCRAWSCNWFKGIPDSLWWIKMGWGPIAKKQTALLYGSQSIWATTEQAKATK